LADLTIWLTALEPGATPWHLYVVRCHDGSLYTGTSTDVARRVEQHNVGSQGAKYTRSRRPVVLAASWGPFGRSAAHRLEHAFKLQSRAEKMGAIHLDLEGLMAILALPK
jgi:putative endonuclease